jgi:hypothetical protein
MRCDPIGSGPGSLQIPGHQRVMDFGSPIEMGEHVSL